MAEFSQELKDTLKELAYTSVWVGSNGEHSFAENASMKEYSRAEVLGESEEQAADEVTQIKKKGKK